MKKHFTYVTFCNFHFFSIDLANQKLLLLSSGLKMNCVSLSFSWFWGFFSLSRLKHIWVLVWALVVTSCKIKEVVIRFIMDIEAHERNYWFITGANYGWSLLPRLWVYHYPQIEHRNWRGMIEHPPRGLQVDAVVVEGLKQQGVMKGSIGTEMPEGKMKRVWIQHQIGKLCLVCDKCGVLGVRAVQLQLLD